MTTFWKAVLQGGACGLAMGLVLLVGGQAWEPRAAEAQGAPVQDIVRAKAFEVVGDAGGTRIQLAARDGTGALSFFGQNEEQRALLGVRVDGSVALAFFDGNGETRAHLILGADGNPALNLYDENGKSSARLYVLAEGSPSLDLSGGKGVGARLTVLADGRPWLGLFDEKGNVIWGKP